MPFGIQLKGFILGLVAAYFIIPFLQGLFLKYRSGNK